MMRGLLLDPPQCDGQEGGEGGVQGALQGPVVGRGGGLQEGAEELLHRAEDLSDGSVGCSRPGWPGGPSMNPVAPS